MIRMNILYTTNDTVESCILFFFKCIAWGKRQSINQVSVALLVGINIVVIYHGGAGVLWKMMAVVILVAIAVGIVVQRAVTNTQIETIAHIKSTDTEGGAVSIRGMITYAAQNKFVIKDSTGTAQLSTCPTWYKDIPLHEGEMVTVIGQIMNQAPDRQKCDFALSVYKIFRDGEVIIVRGQPGKPPWVGYRPSTNQTNTGY